MESEYREDILGGFIPHIQKPDRKWYATVFVLLAIIGVGLFAFVYQLYKGQIVTGMRDNVVLGVYTVNFIFFMGLSYAGALIGGIFHIGGISWGRPMLRMLEIVTITSLIVGPIFILVCIGRPERFLNLFFYARIQSPIIWDVIAIVSDLFFCVVYLHFTYIRDFAKLRDYPNLNIANWRKKFYKIMALGYNDTKAQQRLLHQAQNIMAAIIIPTAIIAYSLLAWLFGMNQRPGWNNSIFAPYFVLSAVYSGIALIIIIMWIYRKVYKLEQCIKKEHFDFLGYTLLLLALFYGYFSFSEYITEWYNSAKTSSILLAKFWDFSEYGFMFMFSNFFAAILPIIVIGIPQFRSIKSIVITSGLIVFALWLKRYLIVIPSLETPYIPIQDERLEWVFYSATWVEWALTLAGIAFFVLAFVVMSKIAPIVNVSEMEEKSKGLKFFYKTRK